MIAPLLCALVFGIIDFGTVMSNRINLRQGTQQAARQATVASFGSSSSCTLTSGPTDTPTKTLMCTAKNSIGLGDDVRIKVLLPNGYIAGQSIVICSEASITSSSGLFTSLFGGKYNRARVKARLESVSATAGLTSSAETALSGSWSWCAS